MTSVIRIKMKGAYDVPHEVNGNKKSLKKSIVITNIDIRRN